ncbi:hypothetical protein BegalDRAFT_2101 [Beggiatoa alba B18LD]|uniref:DUF4145 domain-containing protein n=1 Tax=Beggiatoa alba B18LD TaxID=395493 RepID=I3CH73_9GAMM|nr:DUF4145 domain-containing protein [Beggiatoa alba]EIJ42966.1 hypothetical protein BegalDRAFT_2101 [Beggiatoa alba B18LD]
MAFKLGIEVYGEEKPELTDFICPYCNKGILIFDTKLCVIEQYEHSKKKQDRKRKQDREGYWGEIYDYEASIGGVLKCNYDYCNEVVSFCGDIHGEIYDDETPPIDVKYIEFKYIYPPPPPLLCDKPINFMRIHEKYPEAIKELLKESFSLYWSHEDSCVNKLRIVVEIVVEFLLDALKIPKEKNLSLHNRINKLEEGKHLNIKEYLLAIKWIGNEGSHAKTLGKDREEKKAVNAAYEILNKVLELVYYDEKLLEQAKEINKNKGYKKTKFDGF